MGGSLWRDVEGQLLWALLAIAGAWLLPGRTLRERLALGRGSLGPGRLGLALLGFLLLSNGLHRAIVGLGLLEKSALAEIDRAVSGAGEPALALLAIGLAPALGEELLFRGFLLRWLGARLPGGGAVLGSALLFALAHLDAVQGTAAFVLGVYLGAVAWRGGSLLGPMLCHAVNNTLAVLGTLGVVTELGDPGSPWLAAPALAAAAGLLAAALRGLQPPRGSADAPDHGHEEHPAGPDRR